DMRPSPMPSALSVINPSRAAVKTLISRAAGSSFLAAGSVLARPFAALAGFVALAGDATDLASLGSFESSLPAPAIGTTASKPPAHTAVNERSKLRIRIDLSENHELRRRQPG